MPHNARVSLRMFRMFMGPIFYVALHAGCIATMAGIARAGGDQEASACPLFSAIDPGTFVEHFEAFDTSRWKVLNEAWGPDDDNGGVIESNFRVEGGLAVFDALGDHYAGPKRGVDIAGQTRPSGKRAGSVIMSRQRFRGGRFEARVKIPRELGVATAMWTYTNRKSRTGSVLNHEIDFEFPGRPHENAPPSVDYAALVTWTGLEPGQKTFSYVPFSNTPPGYHIIRFDWEPPLPSATTDGVRNGRVAFYINGRLVFTSRSNVPSEPSPLLLGVWFPKNWAGTPNFTSTTMLLDWVRFTSPSIQSADGCWRHP